MGASPPPPTVRTALGSPILPEAAAATAAPWTGHLKSPHRLLRSRFFFAESFPVLISTSLSLSLLIQGRGLSHSRFSWVGDNPQSLRLPAPRASQPLGDYVPLFQPTDGPPSSCAARPCTVPPQGKPAASSHPWWAPGPLLPKAPTHPLGLPPGLRKSRFPPTAAGPGAAGPRT